MSSAINLDWVGFFTIGTAISRVTRHDCDDRLSQNGYCGTRVKGHSLAFSEQAKVTPAHRPLRSSNSMDHQHHPIKISLQRRRRGASFAERLLWTRWVAYSAVKGDNNVQSLSMNRWKENEASQRPCLSWSHVHSKLLVDTGWCPHNCNLLQVAQGGTCVRRNNDLAGRVSGGHWTRNRSQFSP